MESLRIDIVLQPEDVGFSTSVAQLPGVISQGDTAALAIDNTLEALSAAVEAYGDNGEPVPWVDTNVTTDNSKGD